MSSNKHVKDKMIRIFGKKCFIEELHLRKKEDIEAEKRKYTGKCQRCIMDQLTYHHILEKCRGGKATVENGAILRYINHQWFHRLPKAQQEKINKLFQEYKKQFYQNTQVQFVDNIDTGIKVDLAEIELTDKEVKAKKLHYDRTKEKRELRKARDEYERDSYTD